MGNNDKKERSKSALNNIFQPNKPLPRAEARSARAFPEMDDKVMIRRSSFECAILGNSIYFNI
jgi:hypothetical protein